MMVKSWIDTKLGDEFEIIMGQSPSSKFYNENGMGLPFFQGKKEFGDVYPRIEKWTTQATKKAEKNDVLLSVRAPIGAVNIAPEKCGIGRGLAAIRPNTKTSSRFIFYLLQSKENGLKKQGAGVTFTAITKPNLFSFPISIPEDKTDRDCIVEAIETQFTRLDSAVKSLKAIKTKLGLYRKSVLKAAFEEAESFDKLGNILTFKNGINFSKDQKGQGVLTVDVLNMYSKTATVNTLKLYRVNINIKEDYLLKSGDLLFVRSSVKREGVGHVALFKQIDEPVTFCGFLIRGRLKDDDLDPQYLMYYLKSEKARQEIIGKSSQVVITNISQQNLSKVTIPLMSLQKQKEALCYIEEKFSVIDKLEEVIENSLIKAETLRKSILKSAFEGKLVN